MTSKNLFKKLAQPFWGGAICLFNQWQTKGN